MPLHFFPFRPFCSALAACLLTPSLALAQAGSQSQDWLVFGLESAVVENTAVPGAIVSGGDLSVSRVDIGGSLDNAQTAIYASGNLTLARGTVRHGSVSAGGEIALDRSFTVGPVGVVPDERLAHQDAAEAIRSFSRAASAIEPTGTRFITSYGGIQFEGREPGLNVFSITAEELKNSNGVAIPVFDPETDTIVINVSGRNVHRGTNGAVFLGELGDTRLASILQRGDESYHRRIVWNFFEAVDLKTEGSIEGSVFAPKATLTHTNGRLNGQVVARVVNLLNSVRLPAGGFAGTLGEEPVTSLDQMASYD